MHPQGYDDGSYDDEEEKEIEPQQPKESKDSDRKLRLAFLSTVNSVTRGKVHIETEGRHRSLTAMEGDPVIVINPSLTGSWFNTPKPIGPDTSWVLVKAY